MKRKNSFVSRQELDATVPARAAIAGSLKNITCYSMQNPTAVCVPTALCFPAKIITPQYTWKPTRNTGGSHTRTCYTPGQGGGGLPEWLSANASGNRSLPSLPTLLQQKFAPPRFPQAAPLLYNAPPSTLTLTAAAAAKTKRGTRPHALAIPKSVSR